ncbi:hypothetical protein ACFQ8E_19295 [Isoptericola sp. NPDC056573]|uniref:hypothetical protein n=1 Tax=Isoptericola sp. NPDC056573 TaxID=3345868 RepID=UPI00368EFA0C
MSAETVPATVGRRRRVGRWLPLAFVVVVVGFGVAQILPLPRTAEVAAPPADATAEDVVRAYLDAIDAHDCGTAQDLTAPSFATTTESMCHDAASLTVTGLETVGTGQVNAGFDVDWRLFAEDGSIPEGGFGWTYYLTQGDDGWLIEDAGNG